MTISQLFAISAICIADVDTFIRFSNEISKLFRKKHKQYTALTSVAYLGIFGAVTK